MYIFSIFLFCNNIQLIVVETGIQKDVIEKLNHPQTVNAVM